RAQRHACEIVAGDPRLEGRARCADRGRIGPAAPLFVLDFDDLVGPRAARRRDLDIVADRLADERPRHRRGYGKPALADIGLVLADNLVDGLFLGLLVFERDRRTEFDHLAGEFRDVDDFGARDLVLELHHAAFDEALALARRVVFGIFGDVALLARLGDRPDDGWA